VVADGALLQYDCVCAAGDGSVNGGIGVLYAGFGISRGAVVHRDPNPSAAGQEALEALGERFGHAIRPALHHLKGDA
jgi:hypothetical protein